MKRFLMWLIRWYRRRISPLKPSCCRYEPTCSAYALRALEEYSFFRAAALIVWRLIRCNPFSGGGKDPVPADPNERNDTAAT